MLNNQDEPPLSDEEFQELKTIARKEYGDSLSDSEIREMGVRLLTLYGILTSKEPEFTRLDPSDADFRILKCLHRAIYHERTSPSVRDIASAMGLRSSRSGLRLLSRLIHLGFVYRDEKGRLKLHNRFTDCDLEPRLKTEMI